MFFIQRAFLTSQQHQDLTRLWEFISAAREYVRAKRLNKLQDLITAWQQVSEAPMRELEANEQDTQARRIAKNMARLKIIHRFDAALIDAFLLAALGDITPQTFVTLPDALTFTHGLAEAPGQIAAAIIDVPKEATSAIQAQARAFQWLHFIYDIPLATTDNRCYFPQEDLVACAIKDTHYATANSNPRQFEAFINTQLGRYYAWQEEARPLLKYVPRRRRAALQGAIDAYGMTARQIIKDPLALYHKKFLPSQTRFILSALAHSFD
jgi:phytoene/squalene synthetase